MKCNVLNIKTTKKAWLYFCRHCHESSDCFKYPKKSLRKSPLKSSHTKKILGKFLYPKKYQNQKFETQIKSFDHPHHLNSRVHPPPPPGPASKAGAQFYTGGRDLKLHLQARSHQRPTTSPPPSLREYNISNDLQYPKGIICCLR